MHPPSSRHSRTRLATGPEYKPPHPCPKTSRHCPTHSSPPPPPLPQARRRAAILSGNFFDLTNLEEDQVRVCVCGVCMCAPHQLPTRWGTQGEGEGARHTHPALLCSPTLPSLTCDIHFTRGLLLG